MKHNYTGWPDGRLSYQPVLLAN